MQSLLDLTIEDKNTVKHESASIEDIKWPALVSLGCQAEVSVHPFPKNLETLFLEEDAVSAEFTIEDKDTVKQKSAMIEDTKWPVLVDLGSRAEVLGPIKDSVLDLGGGAVDSSTTTISRLDDLSMKPLEKEYLETGLNSIYGSIYDPYNPGKGEDSNFGQVQKSYNGIYAHINQNVRKPRPEDPGGILYLTHRAGGSSPFPSLSARQFS